MLKSETEFEVRHVRSQCQGYRVLDVVLDDLEPALVHEIELNRHSSVAQREQLANALEQWTQAEVGGCLTPRSFQVTNNHATVILPAGPPGSLADRLQEGPLGIPQALSVANELASTLGALHRNGLLYPGLRPADILFDDDNRPLLAGVGPLYLIANALGDETANEITGYLAPETLGGLRDKPGPSADLYSLGVVLFECLSGVTPFHGTYSGDWLFQHMTKRVPQLRGLPSQISAALNEILQRLLRKDPQDRYQSATGVQHDVSLLNGGSTIVIPGIMDARNSITEPSFVGCDAAVQRIQATLKELRLRRCQPQVVRGASGVGKSRFLTEARAWAERLGLRVFEASARNQSGQSPLASLQQVLTDCIQCVKQDEDVAAALQNVAAEFSQELRAAAPELAAALNLKPSVERELTDKRIAFALASVLGAMGRTDPVMLIVDDVHWADDLSRLVLESWNLVDSPQLLLLLSVPADQTHDSLVKRLSADAPIELNNLSQLQSEWLLESMAGPLPTILKETIWKRSSGNPFTATAVIRGLEEGGVLKPSPSGWSLDTEQLLNIRVSGEAGELLTLRLSRLSDESQSVLAAAAVLGMSFRISEVAAIARIPAEACEHLLLESRRAHLVWNDTEEYVFAHVQVRQAALAGLSDEERRKLHLYAAKLLVENAPDDIFNIAWHFDAADQHAEAMNYALPAAEKARNGHSLATAQSQYQIVLRSHRKLGTTAPMETLRGLGVVQMLDGHYTEAEKTLAQAEQTADRAIDRAELLLLRGELAFKMDDKAKAIQRWEEALLALGRKLPRGWKIPLHAAWQVVVQTFHTWLPRWFVGTQRDPDEADRLAWKLFSRLAHGYWYVSTQASVLYAHLRGMNEAERYPATSELAQAYSEHSPAMSLIPLSRRGIAYGRRSFEIRTEQRDLWGQGQSLHFLAIALYAAGRFEECIDVGQRGVEILNRAGDFWEKHIAQYQVAASLFRLGRFKESVEISEEAYASGLAVGDYQACANLAEIWTRALGGQIPEGILERENNRTRSDVQGIAHVLLARGVQLIADEQFEEAQAVLGDGIDQAAAAGVINTYTSPLPAWKATAIRLSLKNTPLVTTSRRRAIQKQHARTARQALVMAVRFRNELPHALREYAWAQLMAGRTRIALWLFRRSSKIAVRQAAPYESLQTDVDLQRVCAELGKPGADAALKDAQTKLRTFRSSQLPTPKLESVSLADRFDTLLESGREIASTVLAEDVTTATLSAAQRMLRCDQCEMPFVNDAGELPMLSEYRKPLVVEALQHRDVRVFNVQNQEYRSVIVAPVFVRGSLAACVLASSEVSEMFGDVEARLARYIAAIAGAALESADGYRQLQELNQNLENIVQERTAAVEARSRKVQEQANELRETQVELAAARDAAEVANEAKTAFLAQMSHEIRTPLGAVLGFTELLLQTPLQPEQRGNLNRVHSNGTHLHCLLNDLLDLSRIEAGEMTVERIGCKPFSLIFDVLQALRSRADEKDIALTARVVDAVPQTIQTDPTRLRQILTNLIGNAIKFTNDGGVSLLIQTDETRQHLVVQVRDTGVGMAPSTLEQIFEPFRQADESITRKFGGTGLGLSISRKLATTLGGDVSVESQRGVGSTFTVRISTGPLHETVMLNHDEAVESTRGKQDMQAIDVDLTGCRILLADDCESNRVMFGHMLSFANVDCTVVCDGQEAVDALMATPDAFDMLITDMQMPILDGYATTIKLRELGFTLPIVALTANGMLDNESKCADAGFTGYLTKPITTEELLAAVAEFLNIEFKPGQATTTGTSATAPPTPGTLLTQLSPSAPTTQPSNAQLPTDALRKDLAVRFLLKVRDRMDALRVAADTSDADQLRDVGHWLKGTGGMLLPAIGELGREIEVAAQAADFSGAASLVVVLEETVDRLSDAGNTGEVSLDVASGEIL